MESKQQLDYQPKPSVNYGLDAPGLVKFFLIFGFALLAIGFAMIAWNKNRAVVAIGFALFFTGLPFFCEGWLMIFSSKVGKLRARDQLLNALQLKGTETVLDVGCGRGLLLIGAARRLPNGKAFGLDLWNQQDLADNRITATMENARIEGVESRVEVHNGNMMDMPFADGTFDAIVSSNAIHNIYNRDGRRKAINQIVRVLKPGGQVALLDFRHTAEYTDDLRAAGMQNVERSGLVCWIFPPVRVVTGKKP